MEIIRGSLDDISRPSSSEKMSRVSRVLPTTPFELGVLTNGPADNKKHIYSQKSTMSSSKDSDKDPSPTEVTEDEDSELQKAYDEMRRLDEVLSAEIYKLKQIRQQRKALQAKLWLKFLKETQKHSECALEALNTERFLALEASMGAAEEENFVLLFETQVPDWQQDADKQDSKQSEQRSDGPTTLHRGSDEDVEDKQFQITKSFKGNNKQTDFIKRNIELVSSEVGQVLLTPSEKQRLALLLCELDEEEEDSAKGTDSEAVWTASALTGQGYTPEPLVLEQLMEIDSKIHLLVSDEELISLQSFFKNMSVFQGLGSEASWKWDMDWQPGEKALRDIKERREQETRLLEIQGQLELLGLSQEINEMVTVCEDSSTERVTESGATLPAGLTSADRIQDQDHQG
nr:fibrous sheath-interacting protein 1 isoform X1 [Nothobranchius furzeri]